MARDLYEVRVPVPLREDYGARYLEPGLPPWNGEAGQPPYDPSTVEWVPARRVPGVRDDGKIALRVEGAPRKWEPMLVDPQEGNEFRRVRKRRETSRLETLLTQLEGPTLTRVQLQRALRIVVRRLLDRDEDE